MICSEAGRAVQAYVDGELDASHILTVDQHLVGCASCTEQVALLRAMKRALRAEARADAAPDSLRARLARSARTLSTEVAVAPATPSTRRPVSDFDRPRVAPSWRSALPWAAAAALAIGIGGGMRVLGNGDGSGDPSRGAGRRSLNASVATRTAGLDDFAEHLAEHHARPLPPEEIDPARIGTVFSPIVGVPVRQLRLDTSPRQGAYRFAGARLMSVHDEAAATLFYDVGGTRVTVFVFDPTRISIRSACCLTPRVVKVRDEERTVYVGRAKGYSLAVQEKDGVGYAVSADLGEADVMHLAAFLPSAPAP